MNTPAPTLSRSIYGFVVYITSMLLLVIYLLWAFIPTSTLNSFGIDYVPDKYWALAIPSFLIVAILVFGTCLYPGYILMMSDSQPSISHLGRDSFTNFEQPPKRGSIDPLIDVPIAKVNRDLYSIHKHDD